MFVNCSTVMEWCTPGYLSLRCRQSARSCFASSCWHSLSIVNRIVVLSVIACTPLFLHDVMSCSFHEHNAQRINAHCTKVQAFLFYCPRLSQDVTGYLPLLITFHAIRDCLTSKPGVRLAKSLLHNPPPACRWRVRTNNRGDRQPGVSTQPYNSFQKLSQRNRTTPHKSRDRACSCSTTSRTLQVSF